MLRRVTGNLDTQDSPWLGLGGSHHLPPYSILCVSPQGHIQMTFCPETPQVGVPKFPPFGLLQLWEPITLRANLRLRWGLKQSCIPCQELSNGMSHVACTQVNRVNFRLLVVGSQTSNLTPGLSFGHNLCFRCPNEQCKPILDIYVSIAFQWYKESFEPLSFDS